MKAKKILGWTILISVILGALLFQIFAFILLCGLEVAIILFLVEVAISALIVLAVKWITD